MKNWVTRSLCETSARLSAAVDGPLIEDISKIIGLAEERFETVFWDPATDALVDELELADTLECMFAVAGEIRNAFELQHVTVTVVREAAGMIFPRRVFTTCPPEWAQEYTENRYQLWDPIFVEPVPKTPELLHELAALSPMTEDFLRRACRAGIGPSGLVCWCEVSEGTVVAVVLTSSITPAEFVRRMERMEWDFVAVANGLASAFARASGSIRSDPATLSDEELIFLRALASGASRSFFSPDPSHPRSAFPDDLLLCRRLGALTLAQAVVAAASTGILSHAPLRLDDIWFAEATPPAKPKRRAKSRPQLAPRASSPNATTTRYKKARDLYAVRKWRKGWAVFRNGNRISGVIASKRRAERACTQMAWGGGEALSNC